MSFSVEFVITMLYTEQKVKSCPTCILTNKGSEKIPCQFYRT